jgi:histidyl-tRNA synthetase
MSKTYRRLRGTQDILPGQVKQWHYLEDSVRKIMAQFNYQELRTPLFEQTELFSRGIGQQTDIVKKEMYTFEDRGKRSITLKPEMTAPIIRAYIENTMYAQSPMNKLYYLAPLFRQENPQAGRLRQFHQFGAEALGSAEADLDAEIILLTLKIFNQLGITQLTLQINSVGDINCHDRFKEKLKHYLKPLRSEYCSECQSRFDTNPLRILDCKKDGCRKLNANAPKITEHLCDACAEHFESLCSLLKLNDVTFEINPYLVRGLDYYTRTVFEITNQHLGSQDALCGGGRYDLLCRQLGGPDIPAVGFAAGIERILMVFEALALYNVPQDGLDIFIIPLGIDAQRIAPLWTNKFRNLGFKSDQDYLKRSLKAQMREANKQRAKLVLILGENELKDQCFTIKVMATGDQNTIPFSNIGTYIIDYFKH